LLRLCASVAIFHAILPTDTQRRKLLQGLGLESARRRRGPPLTRGSPKTSVRMLVASGQRERPFRRPMTHPAMVVQPLSWDSIAGAPERIVILPLEQTAVESEAENRVLGQGAPLAFSCQRLRRPEAVVCRTGQCANTHATLQTNSQWHARRSQLTANHALNLRWFRCPYYAHIGSRNVGYVPLNAYISAKATMVMQSQAGLELVAEMQRSRKNTTAGAWVRDRKGCRTCQQNSG